MRLHMIAILTLLSLAACGDDSTLPDTDASGLGAADLELAASPTWSTQFASKGGLWQVQMSYGGSVQFGVADAAATDGAAASLVLPGKPELGPYDHAGPAFATQIASQKLLHYGTYRARLSLASCQSSEDVVNGFFTYFNDGADHDGDGLIDNSEIDIEVLCGNPSVVSMSSWTQYTDEENFRKWTRQINFSTGVYSESVSDDIYDLAPIGKDLKFIQPSFANLSNYREMGFDWQPGALRFFLVVNGQEITLWNYTDASHIPKLPGRWMFNVWHPESHWTGDDELADYPAKNAVMRLDWARYWAR